MFRVRLRENQSGLWERQQRIGDRGIPIEVDLLIPHQLAPQPNTRRRTELPPHDSWATKKVPGLEDAAVDRSLMTVGTLTPGDPCRVEAHVAGPAALLVAKSIKLDERICDAAKRPDRLSNKDAGDVYRVMTTVPAPDVARAFTVLRNNPHVGDIALQGMELLHALARLPLQALNSPSQPSPETSQRAVSAPWLPPTSPASVTDHLRP
ncbi:hypothetical protein [Streptomyces sp. NPDC055134]